MLKTKKGISIIKKFIKTHTRSKNTSCKVNNSFMLKFGVGVIRAYKGPKNMYFSIANSFF